MVGRVKRKAGLATAEALSTGHAQEPLCALCDRPLGTRTEWHHLVPKSEGGRVTAPVHPICHRAIHAAVSNADLAGPLAEIATLRQVQAIARFLRWVADKPVNFHAPTRRRRTSE